MTNFDIKISITKLSHYSASLNKSLDKKTILAMIESFSHYILELYGRLIEEAIYSKRYEGNWEPIDEPGYLEYIGVTPKQHILYIIKEALEVRKIGYNFIVRFNPRYKYPSTNIPFFKVIRAIEYGTSEFNARPIFNKITRQIQYHILDLWRGYLSMKGVV